MTRTGNRAPAWWFLVLSLLAFSPGSALATQPYQPAPGDPLLEPWRWRTYLELSGLDAQCMAEGADGVMWFGTANGLWSYDGIEWNRSVNNTVGRIVTSLCSQPDGSLYAAGGWGISQFRNGQWTQLLAGDMSRISEIRDIPIRKLAVGADGSLWAATSWGVLRRRQAAWTLYTDPETRERLRNDPGLPPLRFEMLPDAVVTRLRRATSGSAGRDFNEVSAGAQGRIWFGTMEGEVLCYTPAPDGVAGLVAQESWSVYDERDGVMSGAITAILQTENGGPLWVVHAGAEHASVFDGRKWSPLQLPFSLPPLDLADVGGKLLQTRDGVLWLSARYKLCAYRDGQWRVYEQPEIAYPSTRNAVMQSADGALWFAGPNTEIYRVDYQTGRWLTLHDLNFQWESPAGAQWFLHRSGRVVRHDGDAWVSYGVEDGLMDTPVALLGTRQGDVWAAGSHGNTAATARFDGRTWTLHMHEDFSFAVDWRAVFESSDGSVWFGAFVDTDGPEKHRNGILQYRNGEWIHHHQPGRSPRADGAEDPATLLPPSRNPHHPIEKFICLGESRDGKLWAGRNILIVHDGKRWQESTPPVGMHSTNIETMLTTREGDLWLGTRELGAVRYDGREWLQFQAKDSLQANSVRSLAQTADGSIWAATDRGASRFDGRAWMPDVLPEQLNIAHESGGFKASPSGALWINRYTLYWMRRAWTKSPPPEPDAEFVTTRFQFRGPPPRTRILTSADIISQPGNLAVLWSGVVPWRNAKNARLQYSFRLDDQPWSTFISDRGHSFFTLPAGRHHLEVRARDADFNVDPTPATLDFTVLPPVWQQSWFIMLMVLLVGLIMALSIRVAREQAHLRKARDELEVRVRQRTGELEAANRELEAFSYSVSHDLRTPLRSIDGFSRILMEDCGHKLDDEEKEHLQTVRAAAQRMGQLIDDMLMLGRVTRGELRAAPVDLSKLAEEITRELSQRDPQRNVHVSIAPGAVVDGDANLLRIALTNLLDNAWKFTARRPEARIEFGVTSQAGRPVYFVRDNGAGFDMAYVNKLFHAFQRLHTTSEFPGSGVGLAIVQRVIQRHGGRVWAEGSVDGGATFFFTLDVHGAS